MSFFTMNAFPMTYYMGIFGLQNDLLSKFIISQVSGADSLEIGASSPEGVEELARLYEQFDMQSRVCVCGTDLFSVGWEPRLEELVALAAAFQQRLGTPMVNLCLTPKSGPEGGPCVVKEDEELARQGEAYRLLLGELERLGMQACFHMHDVELWEDWKEIRAMLAANPEMKFCMDPEWIYLGSGKSADAVIRFVECYADQIVHLHIRQCRNGELQEQFTLEGDIDYPRIFRTLKAHQYQGIASLEQMTWSKEPKRAQPFAVSAHLGLEELRRGWKEAGLS